jgi:hypothetical protein
VCNDIVYNIDRPTVLPGSLLGRVLFIVMSREARLLALAPFKAFPGATASLYNAADGWALEAFAFSTALRMGDSLDDVCCCRASWWSLCDVAWNGEPGFKIPPYNTHQPISPSASQPPQCQERELTNSSSLTTLLLGNAPTLNQYRILSTLH